MKKVNPNHSMKMIARTLVCATTLGAILSACARGGSEDVEISELENLPKSSGPVLSSDAQSARGIGSQIAPLASEGQKLSDFGTPAWQQGDSPAFCESGNMVKQMLRTAADSDKVLCYISTVEKSGKAPAARRDGTYNKYRVKLADDSKSMFVQFRIDQKGNAIRAFEMITCDNDKGWTRQSYLKQDLVGNHVTVISADEASSDEGQHTRRSSVVGKINKNGQWLSKEVVQDQTYVLPAQDQDNSQHMELVQYPDSFELSAYHEGDFGYGTYSNRIVATLQGINLGNLPSLALGDGTAKMLYTNSTFEGEFPLTVESFNGDDRKALEDASEGDFYARTIEAELPDAYVDETGLLESERSDCDETGATDVVFESQEEMDALFQGCEENYDFGGGEWVNCSATYTPAN